MQLSKSQSGGLICLGADGFCAWNANNERNDVRHFLLLLKMHYKKVVNTNCLYEQ